MKNKMRSLFLTTFALSAACGSGGGGGAGGGGADGSAPKADGGSGMQVGLLDKTCNGTGKVILKAGIGASVDTVTDAFGQADGSSIVYGNIDQPENKESIQSAYWSNLKLKSDCSIDTSYGNNGINFASVASPDYQVENLKWVTRLSNGTSFVFGESVQPYTLADGSSFSATDVTTFTKLLATGAVDTNYGLKVAPTKSLPEATSPYPDGMTVTDAKVLADGKIITLSVGGGPYRPFAIQRFTAAGAPDASFGTGGKLVLSNIVQDAFSKFFRVDFLSSIEVLGDGKMLVGGVFTGLGSSPSFYPGVMRLNADLSVDTSWGTQGVSGLAEGDVNRSPIVKALPDGKALLFGTGNVSKGNSGADGYRALAVTRLLNNGQIDLSFGTSGVTRVDFDRGTFGPRNANVIALHAATVMTDGKILMAGDSYNQDAMQGTGGTFRHIGLARLTPDGALDPNFANQGVYSDYDAKSTVDDVLRSIRVTDDGKLLVTATHKTAGRDWDWAIFRFTN
jgi:uncharacterized delta-60 repeat protein